MEGQTVRLPAVIKATIVSFLLAATGSLLTTMQTAEQIDKDHVHPYGMTVAPTTAARVLRCEKLPPKNAILTGTTMGETERMIGAVIQGHRHRLTSALQERTIQRKARG